MGDHNLGFANHTTNLSTPDAPYLEIQVCQLFLPFASNSSL